MYQPFLFLVSDFLASLQYGHWIGYFEFLLAIPLIFLLLKAPLLNRPALYYIQIGCLLAWLVLEALLDYILMIDFRNVRWMVISYVVLFFAGCRWDARCGIKCWTRVEYFSDYIILNNGYTDICANAPLLACNMWPEFTCRTKQRALEAWDYAAFFWL